MHVFQIVVPSLTTITLIQLGEAPGLLDNIPKYSPEILYKMDLALIEMK